MQIQKLALWKMAKRLMIDLAKLEETALGGLVIEAGPRTMKFSKDSDGAYRLMAVDGKPVEASFNGLGLLQRDLYALGIVGLLVPASPLIVLGDCKIRNGYCSKRKWIDAKTSLPVDGSVTPAIVKAVDDDQHALISQAIRSTPGVIVVKVN